MGVELLLAKAADVQIIVWACIVAAALLVEFLTYDFSAICLAAAGILTLIVASLGVGLEWQIPAFIVASVLFIIFVRPLCKRFFIKKTIPTNMDAAIGKKVRLIDDTLDGVSAVKLGDVTWTVVCEDPLKKGEFVEIVRAEGNKLIVKGGK